MTQAQGEVVSTASSATEDRPETQTKSFSFGDALGLVRVRDFRLLMLGNALTVTGFQLRSMGQAWLALEETGSAVWVGLINASPAIGMIPLALYAGVVVDRVDRRRILAVAKVVAAVMAFLTAFLVASDQIEMWHLVPIGVVVGAAFAFNNPASMTYVMDVVGRERMMPAISMNQAISNTVQIAGPAVGGVLLATVGVNWVFFLLGGIYSAGFVTNMLLRSKSQHVEVERSSVVKDFREGWNYTWRTPHVRWLMIISFTALSVGMFPVQLPLLARNELGIAEDSQAAAYGALLAVSGVGALIGSVSIVLFSSAIRKATMLYFAVGLVVAGMLVLGAAPNLPVALAGALLVGGAGAAFGNATGTLIQTTVSSEFRGRVTSVFMLIVQLFPLGWLIGGALAELIGPRWTLAAGALVTLQLCSIALWRAKELRQVE